MNISDIRAQYPQYSDMSDQDLAKALHAKFYADIPYSDFTQKIGLGSTEKTTPDFKGATLQVGPLDTGIGIPESVAKRMAQFGSGMMDVATGVRQLAGNATKQDVEAKRALDAKLNNDITGKALSFAGNAAPYMALPFGYLGGALKAAAPIAEGAIGGAITGLTSPVGEGESRALNTALSTGLGALVPSLVVGTKRMLSPDADLMPAVKKAVDLGIPVGPADTSNSRVVRAARSILNDVPGPNIIGHFQNDKQTRAFNRAVGAKFGQPVEKLTPDVLDAAIGKNGKVSAELNRIWNNNTLKVDAPLVQNIIDLQTLAGKLPEGQGKTLNREISDFMGKMAQDESGGLTVPGDVANKFQSYLRSTYDGTQGALGKGLGDLRKSIISAFNRSVGGEDAAALTTARAQYKAAKTIQPLIEKAAVGEAGREPGNIPATLLSSAVRRNYSDLTKGEGKAMADLAAIGSRFVADRTPQMGGTPRAWIQNAATGGLLYGGAMNPALTAGALGGAGIFNYLLGSPALTRFALSGGSPARNLLASPEALPMLRSGAYNLGLLAPSLGLTPLVAPAFE